MSETVEVTKASTPFYSVPTSIEPAPTPQVTVTIPALSTNQQATIQVLRQTATNLAQRLQAVGLTFESILEQVLEEFGPEAKKLWEFDLETLRFLPRK